LQSDTGDALPSLSGAGGCIFGDPGCCRFSSRQPAGSDPAVATAASAQQPAAYIVSRLRNGGGNGSQPFAPGFWNFGVRVGNHDVVIREKTIAQTAFGKLLHFEKEIESQQPRVLVVAPLSGHFATLLRNCVRTLLSEHDVYITDWHNARDVDISHGEFEFDDYVDHIIKFIATIGPSVHVVAVCQPCVQVLAAAALMAEEDHPALPSSMTLMAGPIDARISPTKVNALATSKPIEWFANN
jgi:poly(3-hydroxybutyrate) depolymerase